MRLIDADEFKENVLNGLYIYLQVNKEDIARAIDDAPTVEPEERPQGEWIWFNNHWGLGDWLCNKCEHYAHDKSNFCPNCGAKMDVKKMKDMTGELPYEE